ncbi:MAG: energy transducer TonB [Bacteroidales bacterium]|nr:energy transducer TonB [Bacteroidales bacterium]
MRGKRTCEILKAIRKKIAEQNEIPYKTQQCNYQGECRGTCSKCESELQYLTQELKKRQESKRRITLTGIAMGLATFNVGLNSCVNNSHKNNFDELESDLIIERDYHDNLIENNSTNLKENECEFKHDLIKQEINNIEMFELEGDIIKVVDNIEIITEELETEYSNEENELIKYICENIKYPKEAEENGIEGVVYVKFIIDENGKVTNPEIIKNVDPLLDKEALRVVESMTDWTSDNYPNIIRKGTKIIPIKFKLEDYKTINDTINSSEKEITIQPRTKKEIRQQKRENRRKKHKKN